MSVLTKQLVWLIDDVYDDNDDFAAVDLHDV